MTSKRLLIAIPSLLIVLLLQSYLWVPTYEQQAVGNPQRLRTYIDASIADAKILNPILHADTASGSIVGLIFEGLLDLDENLRLRGRLATDWVISETAYLLVNPAKQLPDGTPVTGPVLYHRLTEALASGQFPALQALVTSIRLLPPERRQEVVRVPKTDEQGRAVQLEVQVTIHVPERLAFSLRQVDQDFFTRLTPIIGERYLSDFPYDHYLEVADPTLRELVRPRFRELLPVAEHNPEILFHLRRGVRFHDGHLFDAGDVKFTYEAIMDAKNLSPRTADFEPVKTLEILDPYTVKVVYKRLYSPAISAWTIGILPEHLLNAQALQREMAARGLSAAAQAAFGVRDSQFNRHPIGTGPFRFVAWQSDEFIHLRRHDEYWEGPPQYEQVYVRIIPDLLTQEVEFRTGAIDSYTPQPHQVVRYRNDTAYQSFSAPTFAYTYIGYNMRNPLFADPRVRRALGMALNVDEIITYILYGEGTRITGPYPANTDWYNADVAPLPYDPVEAQRLLAEVGWRPNAAGWLEKDGKIFEFTLITNSGNPIRKNIMTIAQNAWKRIGVKCHTQYFEWAVFLQDFINTGSFDATVLGWTTSPLDPDLYQLFHSSQSGPQQLNFVGYTNPEVDDLLLRIRQEYDHTRQRELAHQLHRLIAEDQPYTFLYTPTATRALDKKIVIVEPQPDGGERYVKIFPTKSGSITYYFNKWRKLAFTPEF
ncbi:MAG: ABC transporter substrate-binding protein [Candidatus Binatia bacterium]|nr:ABC transporter substrate-binding protein [Candidatus Binatia bacterium]